MYVVYCYCVCYVYNYLNGMKSFFYRTDIFRKNSMIA